MGKKIGLLTFCDNTNFGSFLQTYALYKFVSDMGYDIQLIDYRKHTPVYERVKLCQIPLVIKTYDFPDGLGFLKNMIRAQKSFYQLIKKSMKKSMPYSSATIRLCRNKYDIFLIGSDLVWDIRFAQDYTYMLDFVSSEKKKISYAASYGYEKIPQNKVKTFKKYLLSFDEITVREENEKVELENLLNKRITVVCDPTMLIENSFWKSLVCDINERHDNYILLYMLPDDYMLRRKISKFAREHGCRTYEISRNIEGKYPKNPIEFISLIFYARKIFTGSYHGILFSIYFEKEFSFVRRHPSNRMDTLCDKLGISDLDMKADNFQISKIPDYKTIKENENHYRQVSKDALRKMIADVT